MSIYAIHAETYPEVYARILVVGAVDTDYTICDFSNGGDRVDVYAPGENIASTSAKGYNVFSGTSTAAPQVAGAAACVWFINSGLTGSDVKSIISGTAYASNAEIGVSLLNVYATVTTAQQQADNYQRTKCADQWLRVPWEYANCRGYAHSTRRDNLYNGNKRVWLFLLRGT